MSETTAGPAGALTGTVLSGRYRLESKLGSGGMSTVYLARDETLERWVAAKVLHREISDQPDQIERFRREARAVAQVSHPNVVAVIDAGEDGGRPYIVFEYVDGETLKQRIDRLGRLPLDEAAAYSIEVGRGLAAAHARRLVHRDVKPQNVLIDSEGRAKVTDFGIARELEQDGLTKTGRVLGTTDYVSPEQAMGKGVDARSDIYSLGILLYEMLVGEVPFQADNLVGVAMKHVNERMPDVQKQRKDVSSALAAVIERATEKKPEKRYPDMNAMLADLENALEVEVARAGRSTAEATTVLDSVPRRRRMVPSRRVSIAGVLLVLAATAAALLIAGIGSKDHPHPTGNGGGGGGEPTGAEVELTGAQDFDPEGGDGEHPDEVKLAIDGIPNTTWQTETYTAGPDLSLSGKSGVGLIVEAAEPVTGQTLTVGTTTGGWSADVYAADSGPPDDLAGWGDPVGSISGAEAQQLIDLDVPSPARYYLIWFTKLAEADGGGRVEVSDVTLSGA
jgi:serine/threonine-protein kinase